MSYSNVYMIGIGGIGMSAIARYFRLSGYSVSGYDRTPSAITDALAKEGIPVHFEERPDLVPADREDTLVIYTPAVPEDMAELAFVREKGYRLMKRSQALGEITRGRTCLAVAGTHGKTTTTTMTAYIMEEAGGGCSAFLGGISKNFGSNLVLSRPETVVVEADEFDRSFLQLTPYITAITSIDPDHLDIYKDYEDLLGTFIRYAEQVKGYIVLKKELEDRLVSPKITATILTYGEGGNFRAENIVRKENGELHFDLHLQDTVVEDCHVGVPGLVNIENATAAAAIAYLSGADVQGIKRALAGFQGVGRRFDIHLNVPGHMYIDDYAHHPNELSATLNSIRKAYPGRKVCAVFQPHLFSRTKDFYPEFARSLSEADELILLPIYPAREEPIPGITSEIILERVTGANKVIVEKSRLMEEIASRDIDILVTFGAGDIDRFVVPIKEMLKERYA